MKGRQESGELADGPDPVKGRNPQTGHPWPAALPADYHALKQRCALLEESEGRLRALVLDLERRLADQAREIELAHRQMYQTEKLASVGQLAAGVAHQINNPVGFIKSNLGTAITYIRRMVALGQQFAGEHGAARFGLAWRAGRYDAMLEDFQALLQESLDGVDRVARVVADLKGFSGIDSADWQWLDLNEVVYGACNVLDGPIGEHAELLLELSDVPPCHGHRGLLGQLFLNLLRNAMQAMPESGAIRISTWVRDGTIEIQVTDNGTGIAPEHLPRVFEPFFTTRDVGQGVGLGLTVSRDIVQAHGGRIELASEPGAGTTVTISLPVRK